MVNNLVEDWCNAGLNFSLNDNLIKNGWGLPTAHLEADFIAPCHPGDGLTAKLFVGCVGTSSVKADIVLGGPDGSDRQRGRVVLVLTDSQSSLAVSDALCRNISAFAVSG